MPHRRGGARGARGEPTLFEWERIVLPDLAQVQAGRADPGKTPHDDSRALFGGWRIEQLAEHRRTASPPASPARPRRRTDGRG